MIIVGKSKLMESLFQNVHVKSVELYLNFRTFHSYHNLNVSDYISKLT